MVVVTLRTKGKFGKLPSEVSLENSEVAFSLVEIISRESKLNSKRIRLSVKSQDSASGRDYVLQPQDQLADFATNGALTVYVRDLGPQIAWRTVFVIEYLGPLIIHPIYYFLQKPIYGETFEHSLVQRVVFHMVLAHFIKRELETLYVHKFSMATMPAANLFKNCAHYWLLSGVLLAYFVYAPPTWQSQSSAKEFFFGHSAAHWQPSQIALLGLAWFYAEISNLVVHLNLSSLRRPGTTERKIPFGYGFGKLTSPNYFFEAWSWFIVSVISMNWSAWVFFAVGSLQMYMWAVKKHKRYIREFPDYPKNRKAFIPYVC